MTNQSMLDPFSLWKSMYEQTESNLSEVINETLKKEEYAELLGQVQNGFLQYQQLIQSTTDSYLKQINVPTREEISSVASLIINLEEKVESLDEKIDDKLLNETVSSEINKLKTSISRLDKKMNQVIEALANDNNPSSTTTTSKDN
ncbi:poly(R)-hydroxyalkanoic acid synthase subunit PhaE [Oceanobacillus sp. CF4.6]|uniref:poly(R)-hydroxyalkanoic acid synthase subunit PhaE n=1 Tax=Oceanobacillus sp. CF4.6 TaxID=3373080 RepID=UPI003EE6455C